MANELTTAWNTSKRNVGDWWIDSRHKTHARAETKAAELLPEWVAGCKIVPEGGYFYILIMPTEAERRLMAALESA